MNKLYRSTFDNFNGIICGTSSTKLFMLCEFMKEYPKTFNMAFIFTSESEKPQYEALLRETDQYTFKICIGGVKEFKELSNDACFEAHGNTLMIFDDIEYNDNKTIIYEHFITGRKDGYTSLYINSHYETIPSVIKDYTNVIALSGPMRAENVQRLIHLKGLDIKTEQLRNMLSGLVSEFGKFLLINMYERDPLRVFSYNYNNYLNPADF